MTKSTNISGNIPGLTITATPIGNLADMSQRAIESLAEADIVACEDTRTTKKLLHLLGLKSHGQLVSYHDHIDEATRHRLIHAMQNKKSVTLVADAGTPLISDPGYRLVVACHAANLPITAIPGPSALLAGLVISGLPTDRFYFAGFLPTPASKRHAALLDLLAIPATTIVYEACNRLPKTLAEIAEIAPSRLVWVGRELTKKFEETWRGEAQTLADTFARQPPPKGEAVLIIAPPPPAPPLSDEVLMEQLTAAHAKGLSPSMAARHVYIQLKTQIKGQSKISKSRLYRLALTLKQKEHA